MDTFRFDFRGDGESEGQIGYSNFDDDYNDIDSVVRHFEQQGYCIYALIGHSHGAISLLNYAATSNHVPLIPHIVSISTRLDMFDVKRRHGHKIMKLLDDQVIPVRDITSLHEIMSDRTSLRIIANADHNYEAHIEEISQTVAHYFSYEGRKEDWARRVLPNWNIWVNAVGGVLNFRTVGDVWIPSTIDGTLSYMCPGIIYRCGDQTNKIRRHQTPVFTEEEYSSDKRATRLGMYLKGTEGFSEAYMVMLSHIRRFLPPILEHIVNKRTPFVVHCTGGKDRTGIVCAILQMICGVNEEVIAWEYGLTQRCQAFKEVDIKNVKAVMNDDITEERVRELLSARAEYMIRFLERFHEKYGTIHKFLGSELDMTMEEIRAVRDALVVKIPVPRASP
ncbi:hypothetical protein BGZ99_005567 [Dissophora globulifera]|uniref:Tyrosine specific protein phosphatases domain-containing protein n=1 Tax=Dissophora globulifera TaxID=979702 RepID=A0A9P6RGQ5_9FUNG|nr:hypothetical protein BGZ99_005567 [Dissophora globulifera]